MYSFKIGSLLHRRINLENLDGKSIAITAIFTLCWKAFTLVLDTLAVLSSIPYSIGYVELKWALEKGINYALITGVQFPHSMLPGVSSTENQMLSKLKNRI